MSGKSPIQWTDNTWNVVNGCKRVSAGCDHCYAFDLHDKRHIAWKRGRWDAAPKQYHQPFSRVQLLPERLDDPLHWRKPRRVFVNSMSDLFHEDVPFSFIWRVWEVMEKTPQHTYQILTKRPDRMNYFVKNGLHSDGFILPNVWLGVSVEHQQAADERIPLLLQTPAAVRFLSCEPLLGPVDLSDYLTPQWYSQEKTAHGQTYPVARLRPGLHWVIIGGESGPHARPMHLSWVESLIEQCQESGVAPFVKQLGSVWAYEHGSKDRHGGTIEEWPEALRIRQFPAVREAAEVRA